MRLKLNADKPISGMRGTDLAVHRAAVQIYLDRAHGPGFQVPALFLHASCATIAENGDRLAGKAGDRSADMSFDVHERPSRQGVASAESYHAMMVAYGNREYSWAEIEEDDAARALAADDPVADAVDGIASRFGISELDPWTKSGLDGRSAFGPA